MKTCFHAFVTKHVFDSQSDKDLWRHVTREYQMYFLEKSLAGTTARQSELTNVDTAAKWKYIRCNGEQESWQVEITLLSRRRQALRSHLLNWPIMKNLYVFIYLFCENIHLFRWICHKCAHNKLIHFTPLTCSMYNFHRKRIQVHFNRDFMGEKCCRRWDSSSQSSDLKSSDLLSYF